MTTILQRLLLNPVLHAVFYKIRVGNSICLEDKMLGRVEGVPLPFIFNKSACCYEELSTNRPIDCFLLNIYPHQCRSHIFLYLQSRRPLIWRIAVKHAGMEFLQSFCYWPLSKVKLMFYNETSLFNSVSANICS